MITNSNLRKLVSLLLTALLLVFAYNYILRLYGDANLSGLKINWPIMILAIMAFSSFYGLLSAHWLHASRLVDPFVKDDQKLAFLASQPYKYLPTSLFTFSFRALYAKKLGFGIKKSSTAQLFENASLLLANTLVFAICYLASLKLILGLAIFVSVSFFITLLARQRTRTVKLVSREITVSPRAIVKLFLIASAAWVMSGVAFILLNVSINLPVNIFGFMAANAMAFSLSILAFFAPGGIGVREIVYNSFSVSTPAILFWRIFTFALDMILGLLTILMIRVKRVV